MAIEEGEYEDWDELKRALQDGDEGVIEELMTRSGGEVMVEEMLEEIDQDRVARTSRRQHPEPIKMRWVVLGLATFTGLLAVVALPRHPSLPDNAPMSFGNTQQHQQMLLHPGLDQVVSNPQTKCTMRVVMWISTIGNGDVVQATTTPRSAQAGCTIEKSYSLGSTGQWSDYDQPDSSAEAVGDFTYPLPVDMFALRLCERSGMHCQVTLMVPWPPNAGPMPISSKEPDD